MKTLVCCLLLCTVTMNGCGIEAAIKRNDDRYLNPGALDLPLTNYYDSYSFLFLRTYRVLIYGQWQVTGVNIDLQQR